jgi:predicted RNA binding protein YcfA (HicA-like mRNA interferase family)
MTDRLPQVKPKQLIRVLQRMGFVLRRQTGSHAIFRHPETKNIAVVPMHTGDIKRGLLYGILKQANITEVQFLDNL